MKTTEQLSKEHQAILKGLELLKSAVESWERKQAGAAEDCRDLLGFLKTFADRCHHGKEEKVLFPRLMQAGIAVDGGPLGVMLHEHEQGRKLIRDMESTLDAGLASDFAFYANRYVNLLREHIDKEDNILFVKAEQALTGEDDESLSQRFDEIEREMGEDTHEKFHQMIETLASRYLAKPAKAS